MKKILLSLSALGLLFSTANAQNPLEENVGVIGKITANWCPPCGSWGWTLNSDMLSAAGKKSTGLSIYSSTRTDGGNEKFQNQAAYDLAQKITLGGYPSFSFNMIDVSGQNTSGGGVNTAGIKSDVADSVTSFSSAPVVASVGMTYHIDGNTVKVKTKTKFWQAASGTYKVAVYLVEDGALNIQASQSGTVPHKYVVRSSMSSSTWGKQIATGSINKDDEFDEDFTFDLTSSITPNYAQQPADWDKTKLAPFAVIYKVEGISNHTYVNGTKHYDFPSSVNDVQAVQNATMYPNPATKETTVAFDADKSTSVNVTVVDMMGRTVYNSGELNATTGRFFHTINTSVLAAGVYNVSIATGDAVSTQKLNIVK